MITEKCLESVLSALPRLTIGLVGDLFLDRYLELVPGAHELSIETGLEAYQISHVRNSPGALGTVLSNLAALGAGLLVPATILGDDGHGYDLLREVRSLPVDPANILCVRDRLTPTYTKPMRQDEAGVWRELNRLDVRTHGPLSEATSKLLADRVRQVFHSSDGLIVLDQVNESDWGVVNRRMRVLLAELHRENPEKLIFVDSRRRLGEFACGVLKGNRAEVLAAANEGGSDEPDVERAASRLCERTNRTVYCTLSEQGILIACPGQKPAVAPAYPVQGPIDIVGAGDAATSGMVASLLAGTSELEAAAVGNLVASITVTQLGRTGTATPQQLRDRWQEVQG